MIAGGRDGIVQLFYVIDQAAPLYFKENNYSESRINETMKIIDQTQIAADGKLASLYPIQTLLKKSS